MGNCMQHDVTGQSPCQTDDTYVTHDEGHAEITSQLSTGNVVFHRCSSISSLIIATNALVNVSIRNIISSNENIALCWSQDAESNENISLKPNMKRLTFLKLSLHRKKESFDQERPGVSIENHYSMSSSSSRTNSEKRGPRLGLASNNCQMTLANPPAVNALDLTAPASDALLKNRKNAWVQVAGHPGSFAPASENTIWKKRLSKENYETVAYHALMNDVVKDIVPKFHREVEYGGETFIEIEDLLQHFTDPSIMDIKMGTRTFLESEVKNPVLRKDLYEKMIKLNASEPTAKEHDQKAITKLRYMQFRERHSSTSTLGFRVEALKMSGEVPNTDLKKITTEDQNRAKCGEDKTEPEATFMLYGALMFSVVKQLILQFLRRNKDIQKKLLKRFKEMRRKIEMSKFFKHHEMIGSSILILYDKNDRASAWMIDFAKTLFIEGTNLNHRTPWEVGNSEDGYLAGIDNLIRIFSELDVDGCKQKLRADKADRLAGSKLTSFSSTSATAPHLHNDATHLHYNESPASSLSHLHNDCTVDASHYHDKDSSSHLHSDSSRILDDENLRTRWKSKSDCEDVLVMDRNALNHHTNDNPVPHSLTEKI